MMYDRKRSQSIFPEARDVNLNSSDGFTILLSRDHVSHCYLPRYISSEERKNSSFLPTVLLVYCSVVNWVDKTASDQKHTKWQ